MTVQRIARGQSIYPAPSVRFIPYMYPPLYYYVSAAVAKFTGMGLPALRLTSILSTLGGFGMIYLTVWREVRRVLPALAAAGLYAGCYQVCDAWFDLGRLDSFFVLTILIALYCTRHLHPAIAAIAWTLAFFTKQSILPAAFVILCYNFPNRKRTLLGLSTLAVAVGGCYLWLQHATQGWYSFYVFTVPKACSWLLLRSALEFWPLDIFRPFGLAFAIMLSAFFFTKPSLQSPATRFYISTLVFFPLFWLVRSHAGSSANALMPVYALAAILFGISFARLYDILKLQRGKAWRFAIPCLLGMCFMQISAGIANPGRFRTNPQQAALIESEIRAIRAQPGEVYVMEHPYYGVLAGKQPYSDWAVLDETMPANAAVSEQLRTEMDALLKQGFFSAILVDSPGSFDSLNTMMHLDPTWEAHYSSPSHFPGANFRNTPAWITTSENGQATQTMLGNLLQYQNSQAR